MSMTDKLKEIETLLGSLRNDYPSEIKAFFNFMQKAEDGPALDMRSKELINVACRSPDNASGASQFTLNTPWRLAPPATRS